jgi:hypothetical protein
MPFDNMITEGKARRLTLISLLRDEQPETFVWNFAQVYDHVMIHGTCVSFGCALGRAVQAGLIDHKVAIAEYDEIGKVFDMTVEQVEDVFFGCSTSYPLSPTTGVKYAEVTPAMVADELEKLS